MKKSSRAAGKKKNPPTLAEAGDVEKPMFFVILSSSDSSLCTVPASEVICSENVRVGDEVTFFWNKQMLEGVIKYISDSYDECVSQSMKLSLQMKKFEKSKLESSFHDDKPRKSSMKCKEKIHNSIKRKHDEPASDSQSGGSSQQSSKKKVSKRNSQNTDDKIKDSNKELLQELQEKDILPAVTKNKPKVSHLIYDSDDELLTPESVPTPEVKFGNDKERETTDSSSDSASDNDESDSSSDMEDAAKQKALKLASKLAAKYDVSVLEKLAAGLNKPAAIDSVSNTTEQGETFKQKKPDALSKPLSSEISDAIPREKKPDVPEDGIKTEAMQSAVATLHQLMGTAGEVYSGKMFLVEEPTEGKAIDPEKSSIFCLTETYDKVEGKSKSATAAARRLMEGVFTEEALRASTLTGMPPRGKGKASYKDKTCIRPHLDPKAVKAIIAEALRLQSVKHWKPKKDEGHIRHAMSVRLNELRGTNMPEKSD